MTPEALMTNGIISGRGGALGAAPEPSCFALHSSGTDWVKLTVIPDPGGANYAGTYAMYGRVGVCALSQAGPEDPDDTITITSLDEGIYIFLPVAVGPGGARAKPGNAVLVTTPTNIIEMDSLEMNDCAWEDIWALINRKIDNAALSAAIRNLDGSAVSIQTLITALQQRLDRAEAQLFALRKKVGP
jgi:hypothetical protein